MEKPIDVRFWKRELTTLLELIQRIMTEDVEWLYNHISNPETEEFCTVVSIVDEERNIYAKLSEALNPLDGEE